MPRVRLATFNLQHGRSQRSRSVDLARLERAVAGLDADVLALQEVDQRQPRSRCADLTALAARAAGAADHRFVATLRGLPGVWWDATPDEPVVPDARPGRLPAYGIALLSRFPVRSWSAVALPRRPGLARVGRRRVLDQPRAALRALVETPGGPLEVWATHLTWLPDQAPVQLAALGTMLGTAPGTARGTVRAPAPGGAAAALPPPVVLLGDLNLRPPAVRLPGLRSLADEHTYPVDAPRAQIDHVLASDAMRPLGPARAVDTGLSDHRALVVDVAIDG